MDHLSNSLSKITRILTQVFLVIGCAVLFLLMLLTAMDVFLRYLLNQPLPGAYELVEYMMAIVVPLGLVACAHERGHVAVDLVVNRFSKRTQQLLEVVTRLVAAIFLFLISWQNILNFIEVYRSQVTSSVLLIPEYPFTLPLAVAAAVFGLILLLHFIEAWLEVWHR